MKRLLPAIPAIVERCNISDRTAARLIKNGAITAIRVGRQLRIDEDSLEAWIASKTTGGGELPKRLCANGRPSGEVITQTGECRGI